MSNVWVLIAVAVAVAVVAGFLVVGMVFRAIGSFFYSFETLPTAIGWASILFIAGAGALPLARVVRRNPVLEIGIAVAGAAAAVGTLALVATGITVFFSGDDKQIVQGVVAIAVAITYIILTIRCLTFTFNTIRTR